MFEVDGKEHEVGNIKCPDCWGDYPYRHINCGGLIHSEFGDENYNGDYWLYTKCDKCGDIGFNEDEMIAIDR